MFLSLKLTFFLLLTTQNLLDLNLVQQMLLFYHWMLKKQMILFSIISLLLFSMLNVALLTRRRKNLLFSALVVIKSAHMRHPHVSSNLLYANSVPILLVLLPNTTRTVITAFLKEIQALIVHTPLLVETVQVPILLTPRYAQNGLNLSYMASTSPVIKPQSVSFELTYEFSTNRSDKCCEVQSSSTCNF